MKIILGIIAYIILTLVIGYCWNMVLFRESYVSLASVSLRDAPIMQLGMVAILFEAVALSLIFTLFYTGSNPLTQGLFLGLLVGVFSIGYAGLVVPAKFMIDPIWKYSLLELCFGVIHFSVAGIVLGYIFNKAS